MAPARIMGAMLTNRRARHDYDVLETFEAGLALTGSEVKSLRKGGGSIAEAYAKVERDEVWLEGANIPTYAQASYNNHEPLRPRKLLLHRREIEELRKGLERRGLTVVPLKLFFDARGKAKLEIALARGRKRHDKRAAASERDAKREIDRVLKGTSR
jgi:SsrA-binding protein